MNKDNFKNLNVAELQKEVLSLRKELLNLRLNASAMLVKDYSQFKKLKKKIAQALTLINMQQNNAS